MFLEFKVVKTGQLVYSHEVLKDSFKGNYSYAPSQGRENGYENEGIENRKYFGTYFSLEIIYFSYIIWYDICDRHTPLLCFDTKIH